MASSRIFSIARNRAFFISSLFFFFFFFFFFFLLFFYPPFFRLLSFFSPLLLSTALCTIAVLSFLPHSGGLSPFLHDPPSPPHHPHSSPPDDLTWLEWLHNEHFQQHPSRHRHESEDECLHLHPEAVPDDAQGSCFAFLDQEAMEGEDCVESFLEQIREKQFRQCREIKVEKGTSYEEAEEDDDDDDCKALNGERNKSDVGSSSVDGSIVEERLRVDLSETSIVDNCLSLEVTSHECIDANDTLVDGHSSSNITKHPSDSYGEDNVSSLHILQSDDGHKEPNSTCLASKDHGIHASILPQNVDNVVDDDDGQRNVNLYENDAEQKDLNIPGKASQTCASLHPEIHAHSKHPTLANDDDDHDHIILAPLGGLNNNAAEKLLSIIKSRGHPQCNGDFSLFAHDFI